MQKQIIETAIASFDVSAKTDGTETRHISASNRIASAATPRQRNANKYFAGSLASAALFINTRDTKYPKIYAYRLIKL